jgi:hypothetical protein
LHLYDDRKNEDWSKTMSYIEPESTSSMSSDDGTEMSKFITKGTVIIKQIIAGSFGDLTYEDMLDELLVWGRTREDAIKWMHSDEDDGTFVLVDDNSPLYDDLCSWVTLYRQKLKPQKVAQSILQGEMK